MKSLNKYEIKDVLGDGSVTIQFLHKNESDDARTPKNTDKIRLKVTCALTNDEIVIGGVEMTIFVGDREVVFGLDRALTYINVGDQAMVTVYPKNGYNFFGCSHRKIPADSILMYTVEIIDIQPVDISSMTFNERLAYGKRKLRGGNFWYNRDEFSGAIQIYKRALMFFEEHPNDTIEETKKLQKERIKVYHNIVLAEWSTLNYEDAFATIDKILQLNCSDSKAYYRRGILLKEINALDDAIRAFEKASIINPNKFRIKRELCKLKRMTNYEPGSETTETISTIFRSNTKLRIIVSIFVLTISYLIFIKFK